MFAVFDACAGKKKKKKNDDTAKKVDAVEISEVNAEIFNVLVISSSQLRISFGGIIGYDYNAIDSIARSHGVIRDKIFWQKIKAAESAMLDIVGKSKDKCDAKMKAQCKAQHGKFLKWACEQCKKRSDIENV